VTVTYRLTFVLGILLAACAGADSKPVATPAAGAATSPDRAVMVARVRAETRHAWQGYVQYAWNHDELEPIAKKGRDWHEGHTLLLTPVDALDTLILLGLDAEAKQAHEHIVAHLSFDQDIWVKNFEITIRVLGGSCRRTS
jgi:ER degradation enhancer, mannosidase alpha-like 2